MWDEIWRAVALVLMIEGLAPFIAPARWRAVLARLAVLDDRSLRVVGFGSIAVGFVTLQLLKI